MNTYANRGSALENLISMANSQYKSKHIARIDKVPTPASIQGGFYKAKSTVDFTGVLNGGQMISFDCKETSQKSLPLKNIHQHQIDYMEDIVNLGGYAFIVVNFKCFDTYYRLDFETLKQYWNVWKKGNGRASIPITEFKTQVKQESKFVLHYLKGLV